MAAEIPVEKQRAKTNNDNYGHTPAEFLNPFVGIGHDACSMRRLHRLRGKMAARFAVRGQEASVERGRRVSEGI
jgi:hypothetical protein